MPSVLMEAASAALIGKPIPALCDSCLGRLFASLERGQDNASRGRLIRPALPALPQGVCSVCQDLLEKVPYYAGLAERDLALWDYDTFLVGARVEPETAAREEMLWQTLGCGGEETLKAEVTREIGKLLENRLGKEPEFLHPDIVVLVDTGFDSVSLQVNSMYLSGNYRKLSREIPQARWPCKRCLEKGCDRCEGRGTLYPTSVQEILSAPFLAEGSAVRTRIHALGREDVDARMLGSGRPFVLELLTPKRRHFDLEAVSRLINASGLVEVEGLRASSRIQARALKESRAEKTYRIQVRFDEKVSLERLKEAVNLLAHSEIQQRTPTRVLHRRGDRLRCRKVSAGTVEEYGGETATLLLRTEAGTYVKELVSGDGGRTEPCLAGAVQVPCRVEELDVLEVHTR